MKILAGSFQCESNTFCSQRARIKDFEVFQGDDLLGKMAATSVFHEAGAQVVPLIYASALPSGMVSKEAFHHFSQMFIDLIKNHIDADGIYLYLHGAMYVEHMGSGEEWLVRAIREVVGKKTPISAALDYHANLSDGFLSNVNAVQGFRTAPHTDHDDTEIRAARSLLYCIRNQICPVPSYIRVPFLGGDAATTDKEPFLSITERLCKLDAKKTFVSCAFFNGQPWYDSPYTGNCAVVSGMDREAGKKEALILAGTFWEGRSRLTICNAMQVNEAIEASLANEEGVLFVTDSGDNTTAGASGEGTLLLKKYLCRDKKGVLVCGILAKTATELLLEKHPGESMEITLCKNRHEKQEIEMTCKVVLKKKGSVYGWTGEKAGEGVFVSCGNTDIVLTNARAAFTTPAHFEKMGIMPADYRVIVLKMGYLFPKLKQISGKYIFALTPGASSNDFTQMDYQKLKKKMYPIDKDITWEEIVREAEVNV